VFHVVTRASKRNPAASARLAAAEVRRLPIVVSRQAVLVGVGEVVGGELVEIGGPVAQHRHGEVLQEVGQAGRDVEIHRRRRLDRTARRTQPPRRYRLLWSRAATSDRIETRNLSSGSTRLDRQLTV